jgi:hypothetical protein
LYEGGGPADGDFVEVLAFVLFPAAQGATMAP